MANNITKFVKGANSTGGLPKYLQYFMRAYGTATVASGATTVVVTDADVATNDIIILSPVTKGANAAYVVGYTISNGVSFTVTVNTDPGAGGLVLGYIRLRKAS